MKCEQLNKNYQKKYFEGRKRNYSGDTRAPVIKVLAQKYIGKKVFDVGTGSGALINVIPEAIAIDLAPKHSNIREGDITKISFDKNYFDTIFALEVLEHLDNETLYLGLQEVYRVLKDGGYFIVTSPFKENLQEGMAMCPKCESWFHKDGHVRSFDENSITTLLQKNRFNVLKIKVIPLESFGRHPVLKVFWRVFNFFGLGFKPNSVFVVSQKDFSA